jgi:hypothetical protein
MSIIEGGAPLVDILNDDHQVDVDCSSCSFVEGEVVVVYLFSSSSSIHQPYPSLINYPSFSLGVLMVCLREMTESFTKIKRKKKKRETTETPKALFG